MSYYSDCKNYLALQYNHSVNPIIHEICAPLFTAFGITSFRYARIFNDGHTYFLLTSHHDWLKHHFRYDANNSAALQEAVRQTPAGGYYYFPWPLQPDDPVLSGFYHYNIWHGLAIYKRQRDFVEAWCFASNRENEGISKFYYNGRNILESFILYFNKKAGVLMDTSDTSKLAHWKHPVNMEKLNNPLSPHKINTFIQQLSMPQAPGELKEDEFFILSKRQNECLFYLTLGKTAKETAYLLGLSPRTIYDYIGKIKKKTGYRRKQELINLFLENRLL